MEEFPKEENTTTPENTESSTSNSKSWLTKAAIAGAIFAGVAENEQAAAQTPVENNKNTIEVGVSTEKQEREQFIQSTIIDAKKILESYVFLNPEDGGLNLTEGENSYSIGDVSDLEADKFQKRLLFTTFGDMNFSKSLSLGKDGLVYFTDNHTGDFCVLGERVNEFGATEMVLKGKETVEEGDINFGEESKTANMSEQKTIETIKSILEDCKNLSIKLSNVKPNK